MKTFILSLVLFTIISCSKNDAVASFTPQTITPILIGKGNLSGSENISQQNIAIYNITEWNIILNSLEQGTTSEFSETTGLDFNNYQLIALFDNLYPSPKFDIIITNIIENVDNIIVNYQKIPLPIISSVYSQSFYIVKTPKSTKPVVFQLQ